MKRLSLIGLGIANERSISLEGLERIKNADKTFAEFFTSILEEGSMERLQEISGKKVEIIDREDLEEKEVIINSFDEVDDICFLTAGDPLTATTHQELRFDAIDRGIQVDIINSGSIFIAAAGLSGLQHYKFGRTTTLAIPEGNYFPTSPLDMMIENHSRGLHTLILLDIQAHNNRYMTADEGCKVIIEMIKRSETEEISQEDHIIAVLRAGRKDNNVFYGTIKEISKMELGPPPHCLIFPGKLHFMEEEALERFKT